MINAQIKYDTIRYNPELEGFEAAVCIRENAYIFTYPVSIKAPLKTDYTLVARGLIEKAEGKHGSKRKTMRSQILMASNQMPIAA